MDRVYSSWELDQYYKGCYKDKVFDIPKSLIYMSDEKLSKIFKMMYGTQYNIGQQFSLDGKELDCLHDFWGKASGHRGEENNLLFQKVC